MTRLSFALLLAGSAILTAACGRPQVHAVRGPDGSGDWMLLTCRHMDKRCFRSAESMCQGGYYFTPAADAPSVAESNRTPAVVTHSSELGRDVKSLPPQQRWDSQMYSHRSGSILVKCSASTATASR